MIEIDETTYIVGIWFSSSPLTNKNWMACIIKDPENTNKCKGWIRFRHVKGDKIFNSEDVKQWMTFISKENESEDEAINSIELFQKEVQLIYPYKDKIIVKGDINKMMSMSKNKDWIHTKDNELWKL